MKLDYLDGATPLTTQELEELIPTISIQRELNELEKANIKIGVEWAENSRFLKKELLSYTGLFRLHKKLFDQVWKWAGTQRKSEVNIGNVSPHQISERIHQLCLDTQFWIENKTYPLDKIAIRFHHSLVFIHPFVNGNGRHARIATDLLLLYNGNSIFSWGAGDLAAAGEVRSRYIAALRAADRGDYAGLLEFARS